MAETGVMRGARLGQLVLDRIVDLGSESGGVD